jgi:hypothetical protein
MTQTKRWGNHFEDKRDWQIYQDELVKRYEIYLDLDWVATWDAELEEMNKGKCGAPYQYPHSMITFQSRLVEKFTTRGAEAITRKLEEKDLVPKCNDHATIHRRVLEIDVEFDIPKGALEIGTDGSGTKMTNAGEYFQSTYGKTRRRFAKVVITATKEDILAVDVVICENGNASEVKIGQKHIEEIINKGGKIIKAYNDGAFDSRSYFNTLQKYNIASAIRIRANASTKSKGSFRRKKEVLLFKELGYKQWSKTSGYGHRWPKTEGHFSGIKRGYGDSARAKKRENVIKEIKRKVWIYDQVRKYGRKGRN